MYTLNFFCDEEVQIQGSCLVQYHVFVLLVFIYAASRTLPIFYDLILYKLFCYYILCYICHVVMIIKKYVNIIYP